ncbi:hypothetical protein BJV82DRAFT_590038 [Fennellomyces sp. T-0311]|nr:hypothetical protein BJV82DRAFT_590038 [Fennellomyces sp. T-0311]
MINVFSILSFTLLALSVCADVPPARANHGCVLLQSTIYCYGGRQRGTPPVALQNGLFYTLDLSKGKSVSELHGSWELNDAGNIGTNYYMAMVALPKLNSFLIDGGTRGIVSTPQAYTFMYNAAGQGSWNISIPSGGHLHVDSHTAVADPGGSNRVYISGGRILAVYGATGISQYPTQMVTFDPPSKFGSSVSTLQSLTSQTRLHHKGAFVNDGTTIWFVGGIYPVVRPGGGGTQYIYAHVDMYDILTYDTVNAMWGNKTASGVHPTPRMDHSLTLKPSTNELIVYGGTELESDQPIGDYFYILDVDNLSWSNQTLGTPNGAQPAGPRFGHAAVLVGNNSLFIIFGSNGAFTSDLFVLNIDNWSWMARLPAYITDNATGIEPEDPSDDTSSGLSIGALVGIIVGSVAFVC